MEPRTAIRRLPIVVMVAGLLATASPAAGLAQECSERPALPASPRAHLDQAVAIVLARAQSAVSLSQYTAERLGAASVIEFETQQVLFGKAESRFHLLAASRGLAEASQRQQASLDRSSQGAVHDPDFDRHRNPAFWDLGLSRTLIGGTEAPAACPPGRLPVFHRGASYLLFVTAQGELHEMLGDDPLTESLNGRVYSGPLSTASGYHLFAERVEGPDDLWLAAVERMLGQPGWFAGARDLFGNPRWLIKVRQWSDGEDTERPVPILPADYLRRMRAVYTIEVAACSGDPAQGTPYARGNLPQSRVCLRRERQIAGPTGALPFKLDWARYRDLAKTRIQAPARFLVFEYDGLAPAGRQVETLVRAGIGWTRQGETAAGAAAIARLLPIEAGRLDFTDLISLFDFSARPRAALEDLIAELAE